VGIQVYLQINGKGGVARARTSLDLEVEVAENWVAYCGIRGTLGEAEFGGFDDMVQTGDISGAKGKTDRFRSRSRQKRGG